MGTISEAYEQMMKDGTIKRPRKMDEKSPLNLPNDRMEKIELLLEKIIKHFNIK
jgi:hypothetical protein